MDKEAGGGMIPVVSASVFIVSLAVIATKAVVSFKTGTKDNAISSALFRSYEANYRCRFKILVKILSPDFRKRQSTFFTPLLTNALIT